MLKAMEFDDGFVLSHRGDGLYILLVLPAIAALAVAGQREFGHNAPAWYWSVVTIVLFFAVALVVRQLIVEPTEIVTRVSTGEDWVEVACFYLGERETRERFTPEELFLARWVIVDPDPPPTYEATLELRFGRRIVLGRHQGNDDTIEAAIARINAIAERRDRFTAQRSSAS